MKYRKSQEETDSSRDHFDNQIGAPGPIAQIPAVKDSLHTRSMLRSWAILSGIGARIIECQQAKLLSLDRITDFESELMAWYNSASNCCKEKECLSLGQSELPFCLRPLWHYTFMTLTTDLDLLEAAVGRNGPEIPWSKLDRIKDWISSPVSKRCLLHALYLQKSTASITVDSANAIHTPRIIFSAALCWYSYMLYLPWCTVSLGLKTSQLLDESAQYLREVPESQVLRDERATSVYAFDKASTDLRNILGTNRAEMKVSTLCILEATLRRLGTSGISRLFADLIQAFITGETP